jgi:hypothetical protein
VQSVRQRQAQFIETNIQLNSTQGALVVRVEDGELLVIKPQNEVIGLRLGVNELISALLGLAIEAPVIEPQFVELDQAVLESSGLKIRPVFHYQKIRTGLCFGVKYFPEISNATILGKTPEKVVINGEKAVPLLILDSWVHNTDRWNLGNLIFVRTGKRTKTMYGIDFGSAFGSTMWTTRDIIRNQNILTVENHGSVLDALAKTNLGKLDYYLKKVEAVTREQLEILVDQVPLSWRVNNREKLCLINYLENRKALLRPTFEKFLAL